MVNLAFTLAVAYLVSRRMRSSRVIIDVIVYIFLWIFFVTLQLLIVGLAGFLAAGPLGLLSVIGLMIILSISPFRRELLLLKDDFAQLRDLLGCWWQELPKWVRAVTVAFLAITILRVIFLTWALPPFVWDSLTYHLTNVAQWIQVHRIAVFDTPVQRIFTAANYEVLATWFAVFIHHDAIIELSGLPAYLLAGFSIYAIGLSLDLPAWASWIAAMAYLSTPALTLAITGTKNDPLMAGLYLMSFAIVIHVSRRALKPGLDDDFGPLIALVMGLLYAIGTKAYIIHQIPGLVLTAVVFSFIAGDGWFWCRVPGMALSELRRRGSSYTIFVSFLIGSALFLGSYWYMRNWILMGNPVYPYGVEIGTIEVLEERKSSFKLSPERFFDNLKLFVSKFGDKQARITPDLSDTTGWGWIAYGMGIPAAIWALIRRNNYRIVAAGFLLSFLGLMLSSPTSPWNMRYMIWFPALFALAIGLVFSWLDAIPKVGTLLRGLFIFTMSMDLLMVMNYNLVKVSTFNRMLSLPVLERDAALLHVHVPEEYESVIEYVPVEAILGYNVSENGFVYPLFRSDFSQEIVYIPIAADDSCEQIAQAMEARGTRYLLVAPEHTPDGIIAKLRDCARSETVIRDRAGGLYVIKR